jgi:hypothetical protein
MDVSVGIGVPVGTSVSVGMGKGVSEAGDGRFGSRGVGVEGTPHNDDPVLQAVNDKAMSRVMSRFMADKIIPFGCEKRMIANPISG